MHPPLYYFIERPVPYQRTAPHTLLYTPAPAASRTAAPALLGTLPPAHWSPSAPAPSCSPPAQRRSPTRILCNSLRSINISVSNYPSITSTFIHLSYIQGVHYQK